MAITNLTGTKWCINNTIYNTSVNFSVNFTTNSQNCTSITQGSSMTRLKYTGVGTVYDEGWSNQQYRLITITGGTDATPSGSGFTSLAAWLEANARQVPVVDLTDTTWVLNNTLTLVQLGVFAVNYCYNGRIKNDEYSVGLTITDTALTYKRPYPSTQNQMAYTSTDGWNGNYYLRIIKFLSSNDTTNPNLIDWLTANAVLSPVNDIVGTTWKIKKPSEFTSNINYSSVFAGSFTLKAGNRTVTSQDNSTSLYLYSGAYQSLVYNILAVAVALDSQGAISTYPGIQLGSNTTLHYVRYKVDSSSAAEDLGDIESELTINSSTDGYLYVLHIWLVDNATYEEPASQAGVEVTYNGSTIKTLTENGSFTLSTNGKYMASDVVISATDLQAITATYNGNTIINGSGTHTYTLSCNGEYMSSDIVVNVTVIASGYDLSVSGSNYSASSDATIYLACNSPNGEGLIYDGALDELIFDEGLSSPLTNISSIYLWCDSTDDACYYTLDGNTVEISNDRQNPTQVSITQNSSILLIAPYLD